MSSPSNQPYRSRLLNLINRYYIKLNSQIKVKFRELGYVIQGGLQKAALPLFWLWQSGRKIGQAFSSGSPSSTTLTSSDRDYSSPHSHRANYLIEAVHQNLSIKPVYNSLFSKKFQGLASRLKDQQIVVIVAHNKIKNIVPQLKQEEIKFSINNTINNYPNKNLSTVKNHHQLRSLFPKFSIKRKNKFNQRVSETNQPEKSSLLSNSSESIIISSPKHQIVSAVDNLFSRWEELITANNQANNSPTKENRQLSGHNQPLYSLPPITNKVVQDIMETSSRKLQEVLPIVKETTSKIVFKGVDQLQIATNNLNKSIEEDPFQIRMLIIEAINYFFNNKTNQNKSLYLQISNKLLAGLIHSEIIIIEDQVNVPWLSWEDLYGNQKPLSEDNFPDISTRKNAIAPKRIQVIKETVNINKLDSINHHQKSTSDQSLANSTIATLSPKITEENSAKTLDSVAQLTTKNAVEVVKKQNSLTVEKIKAEATTSFGADAIEAQVTEIKYEKHFLEIILEKLDQFILWLEEKFLQCISIIKILITNMNNNQH